MSPDEQSAKVAEAERFLRRGELLEAVAILRRITAEHPEREDLTQRIHQLAETMQPAELRAMSAPIPESPRSEAPSPEEEGERLFAAGDFAGAALAYRRALEAKPNSELIRERLVELFQLAQAQNGARPRTPPPTHPVRPVTSRDPARGERVTPEDLLEKLLSRIGERRRGP